MALPRHLLAACMCTLLISFASAAGARTRTISGVVETSDGTRLPGVDIRVTNVGGKPTSDSGEFTISLTDQLEPGSEIEFYVAGWTINSPYEGKIWIPKDETVTIHIVVSRTDRDAPFPLKNSRTKSTRNTRRLQH